MKTILLATALAFAMQSPAPALAKGGLAGALGGRALDFSQLKPNTVVLSVVLAGKPDGGAAATQSSRRRAIYVDGILMEMDEEMIVALIRSGIFTVVYPGTNIPWDKGGDRHPNYPPDWVPQI